MDSTDQILLRRRLLDKLDRAGAPLNLADLAETQRDYNVSDRELRKAVDLLAEKGYLENVYQPDEPYYEITNAGRAQLTRTANPLDLAVWGRLAL